MVDGTIKYQGKAFVDPIGSYQKKISRTQVKQLIDKFDKSNFFNFDNSYTSKFTDLPTKYVTYRKDNISKEIMVYDNVPQNLKLLIEEIKKIVFEIDWNNK